MKLALALLLAIPAWSQVNLLPPAGNDWWKTDEAKAWVVYGSTYLHGVSAAAASAMAASKPIQPLYDLLAQNLPQAAPAPALAVPVVLPADILKAVVTALGPNGTGELPDAILKELQTILVAHPEVIAYIPSGICGVTALCDKGVGTLPGSPGLPAPAPSTEPSQVVGIGVGVQGLGPAQFQGGDFIAQHIATNTYAIEATDFVRMPGGGVGTSATAGVLNILHRIGPVYVGVVGTAGAAEGATGSASGALSGWGVLGSSFGSKSLGAAFAAQTTKVAGAPGPTGQFKFYLTYSWFK